MTPAERAELQALCERATLDAAGIAPEYVIPYTSDDARNDMTALAGFVRGERRAGGAVDNVGHMIEYVCKRVAGSRLEALATFPALLDENARLIERAEDQAKLLDRFRLAISEACARPPSGQVTAYYYPTGDRAAATLEPRAPKPVAIEPYRLQGVYEAILEEVRKLGDWQPYSDWERGELDRLRAENAGVIAERTRLLERVAELERGLGNVLAYLYGYTPSILRNEEQ